MFTWDPVVRIVFISDDEFVEYAGHRIRIGGYESTLKTGFIRTVKCLADGMGRGAIRERSSSTVNGQHVKVQEVKLL